MSAPTIPVAPGWPIIGNAIPMAKDPLVYFLDLYHRLGPIYEVRAFHHRFVVMAGQEANHFLARKGGDHFAMEPVFGEFGRAIDSDYFIIGTDGARHRHLRKLLKNGYSKFALSPHMDALSQHTKETLAQFQEGESFDVIETFRVMITDQLGMILNNALAGGTLKDLQVFFNTVLNVGLLKSQPRWTMYLPKYRRAKRNILALAQQVLDAHKQTQDGRSADVIDDLLQSTNENGEPLPDIAVISAIIGGFFAGMDTVTNTLGFLLYAVHHHKEVLPRIQEEIDALFAKGEPLTLEDFKGMKALYGTILETMRMYPILASALRYVQTPFTFQGHEVKEGQKVMVSVVLTHFMEEYFSDPMTFDIDRFLKPRQEHRQHPSIYAPFALGPRTCLGAGMAEQHCMLTLATLLYYGEFSIEPADYQLDVRLNPIRSPKGFKLKYVRRRHT